jgi:uncharacterized protein (TIGR02246 family)
MNQRVDDLAAIEALRRRDEAASKAWDAETLAALWTEDAVAIVPGQAPTRGRAAIRSSLEAMKLDSEDVEILEYEERFEETLLFGDHAVEWGVISGSERSRASGQVSRSAYHVMRVLRRTPEGWRVARSIFHPAPVPPESVP